MSIVRLCRISDRSGPAVKSLSSIDWWSPRNAATLCPKGRFDAATAIVKSKRRVLGVVATLAVVSATAIIPSAMAAPIWAVIALCLAVSSSWWLWLRIVALNAAAKPKLSFFSGDSGTLRLSEDLICSKIVYCIGVRNDGLTTVRDVRVNVDLMEGVSVPTFPARLKVFGAEEDCVVLHPNESEYFCVMKIVESSGEHSQRARLCCHRDLMNGSIHPLELLKGRVLTVSASGERTPKVTNQLRVVSKYDRSGWSLAMTLSPGRYGPFDAVRP
jgi:hypothetical protein